MGEGEQGPMPLLVAVGRVIRELREERGLSRDELAAAAGIKRGRLEAIEAGRQQRVLALLALSEALGVTLLRAPRSCRAGGGGRVSCAGDIEAARGEA